MSRYREIWVTCPKCGHEVIVQARGYQVDKCLLNVVYDIAGKMSQLDWDTANIEADFVYECPDCGHQFDVASSDDFAEWIRDGKNGAHI